MNTDHKYFTLAELVRSRTAEAHKPKPIDNTPPAELLPNLHRLMDYLDLIREAYGKPIRVSSGYRCYDLNRAVGGSSNSQHKQGLAADLVVPDLDRLLGIIRKLGGFDQLIDERPRGGSRWVHVSVAPEGGKPRGQVMRYDGKNFVRLK
nr:D-Ala-D-Ala carboxypeptidase family metallohydrolase [uncultured Porphyromonas sp.]